MVLNPLCEQPSAPAVRGRNRGRKLFSTQMLLIMNLTAVFLLFICLTAGAHGFSQISISEKNTTLPKVFKELKKQSGFDFVYPVVLVERAGTLSVELIDVTLEEALTECLKGKGLAYSIVGKTVIIRQKEEPQLTEQPVEQKATIDIGGRITDRDGNPLQGASITVKGNKNLGTTTDVSGVFTLKGLNADDVIVISYTGYKEQIFKVGTRTNFVLVLEPAENNLQEVVINKGYYNEKRATSTSNVYTVTSKEIGRQPVNNPLLALYNVPGLLITQGTGLPGSGVTVRIQGQNSLTRGNDPLYVIDGVPYTSQLLPNLGNILGFSGGANGNPLSYINPSDIESMDILKDADATAIYGSRAANGAILITTKKGKVGKTKVDINLQQGWGEVPRKINLLNTQQFLEMRREAIKNDGLSVSSFDYDINGFWDTTRYTDWQNELIGGTAQYTDVQTSISGGNVNTQFLVGAGYHRETTVFPGNLADQKGSLHFNINNISNNQKFRLQLSGSYLVDNNRLIATDLTSIAVTYAPNAPSLYNSDGSLNWAPNSSGNTTLGSTGNPLSYLYNTYKSKTSNLVSNALVSYNLFPGFDIKSSFGYTNLQTNEISIGTPSSRPPESRPTAQRRAQYVNNNINSWIIEPQASYKKTIGSGSLDALLGITIQQNNSNGQQLVGLGYNSDAVMDDIRAAASLSVPFGGTIMSVYKYNALFGRLNYNLKDRYIINLTARRDGSSRFGAENQFHNFSAVGLAWVFSRETFIQDALSFLSFGKLSGSYGTTGSDQIGDYQFLNLYNSTSAGIAYQGATGLQTNGIPNPYLQWEETNKMQFVLDLGLLNNRLTLSAAYARNRSSNQLLSYTLPIITGVSSITRNFPATIENTSLEFSLNSVNLKSKNFTWNSIFNLTIPSNKLVDFPNLATSTYASTYVIGQSITSIRVYDFLGVNPTTGLFEFNDRHGSPTSFPNFSNDRTILINTAPEFYGGFQNSVSFKGFELNVLFQFVKQKGQGYSFGNFPGFRRLNQPSSILNRWQKPGDIAANQFFDTQQSDQWGYASSSDKAWGDASYIRLKNLALSWRLSNLWSTKTQLRSCKLYVQAQNLFTLTNYIGLDPETRNSRTLPPLRVLTMGVQITL